MRLPDSRRGESWGDGRPDPTLSPTMAVSVEGLALPGGLCGPSRSNRPESNIFGNSLCREIGDGFTYAVASEAQMVCATRQRMQAPASPSAVVTCESDSSLKLRWAVPDLAWPADLFLA